MRSARWTVAERIDLVVSGGNFRSREGSFLPQIKREIDSHRKRTRARVRSWSVVIALLLEVMALAIIGATIGSAPKTNQVLGGL